MEYVSNFSERLKEYRESKGLTFQELSNKTGVPAATLNRYELGKRKPKIDTANYIAEKLEVNPLWLSGFDVPMSQIHLSSEVFAQSESKASFSIIQKEAINESDRGYGSSVLTQQQEQELVNLFIAAPLELRAVALDLLRAAAKQNNNKDRSESEK